MTTDNKHCFKYSKQIKRIEMLQRFLYMIVILNVIFVSFEITGSRLMVSGSLIIKMVFIVIGVIYIDLNNKKIKELASKQTGEIE